MSKRNYFVIFLKKINLSINNLLKKNLNKLNLINLSDIIHSNKVFLTFFTLIILFLSYLSIPHTFNKEEIQKELENQLINKFSLNFVFSKKINYKFFPRPHFIVEDTSILDNEIEISTIKKLYIFVSLDNLLSLKNISVRDIVLENTNFNFNKKNSSFFIKLLDQKFNEKSFTIINSKVFFHNDNQEVLFINKILEMKYFYDPKELKNVMISENEIFNIPYSFNSYKNEIKNKIFSKLNLNPLKLQIENELNYSDIQKKGQVYFTYNKNKSKASYEWNGDNFNFELSDDLIDPKFFYKGNINFNPFYSNFFGNIEKLNLSNIFQPSSISSQLFKTEIFNNKTLNIDLSIKAKKIAQIQNIIDIILNFKVQEGLIDIDYTKFSWNNYADFKILDSLLYIHNNQLILDGTLSIDIKNYDEIYKFLQISKNLRPQLEKIEFNFLYNFDQQMIDFNDIKINNNTNKQVENILKKLILKDTKLQNKFYFKKMMKKVMKAYVG
jgi:hypothetical protein